MKEYLDENTLFTTLVMLIAERAGTMLVVEGKYDELALKKHSSRGLEVFSGVGGREHITRAARIAHEQGLRRVKFLVDRDYDPYVSPPRKHSENVLVSNAHNLFTDLLQGEPVRLLGAIETVLVGVSIETPECVARDVLKTALMRSAQLASLRIVSAQQGLGLSFESARLSGALRDKRTIEEMAHLLALQNRNLIIDPVQYGRLASSVFEAFGGEFWSVVGDHDLLDALSAEVRARGGSVGKSEFQRIVVAMIGCKAVKSSVWFDELQAWCRGFGVDGFECDSEVVVAA